MDNKHSAWPRRMKLSPYRLGLYEKAMPNTLSFLDKVRAAKEAGFDFIELSIDESDEKLQRLQWTKAERSAIRQMLFEEDFSFDSICLSGHRKYPLGARDHAIREKALWILFAAVDLACDLGVHLIQLAGYDVYYEEGDLQTRAHFEEGLRQCVQYAMQRGVCLGFETMETPFMDTVEKAMHFVRRVGSPILGVYPDIGNLTNASLLYKHTVKEDLETGAGHIFAAHLKETVPGVYREVPFGTGHTQFEANIQVLHDLGVRRFVGECWDTGGAWEAEIKQANAFLRQHLNAVFSRD